MSEPLKVGRRGFLGIGAAVAAGVTTGVRLPRRAAPRDGDAAFEVVDGFPDRPVNVRFRIPGLSDGATGLVRLVIETPRETLTRDVGEVRFERGAAVVTLALAYPYDTRVPGDYRYHAEVVAGGARAATATPAAYSLRPFHWFS